MVGGAAARLGKGGEGGMARSLGGGRSHTGYRGSGQLNIIPNSEIIASKV